MKSKDQLLLEQAYQSMYLKESKEPQALEQFASDLHELWRNGWIKQNGGESLPRMKKGSNGEQVDINVPFAQLDPAWRKENEEAAKAALHAVKQFPEDEEAAADFIHQEWMKRNPKGDWNAAQHVPYESLPEDEKEKDRVHYRKMKSLLQ